MTQTWLKRWFGAGTETPADAPGVAPEDAPPADRRGMEFRRRNLADAARIEALRLGEEASRHLGLGDPSVQATWACRTAEILAEAGDGAQARSLLARSLRLVDEIRDGISATMTLCEVAHRTCACAYALGDEPLYRQGMDLIARIPRSEVRALALAEVFDGLAARGDATAAGEIKSRLLAEIASLEAFSVGLVLESALPHLTRNPGSRSEVVALLEDAARRARQEDAAGLAPIAVRDVATLFAQAGRDLPDDRLVDRATEFVDEIAEPDLRAGLLGEIAMARATLAGTCRKSLVRQDLGATLARQAQDVLQRQQQTVELVVERWDRRTAERHLLAAAAVVAAGTDDAALAEETERSLATIDDEDPGLAILTVSGALARYADRALDAEAARRAVRIGLGAPRDSTKFGEIGLLVRALHACELTDDARALLGRARDHAFTPATAEGAGRVAGETGRCGALLAVARAVVETGLTP